ncbi:baseplate protein [Pseudomonas phage vB_PcuM_ KLEP17-4]|nr:baseplate protein [Pseudomonas phage vB_PcuM_ KLEP17-4]
MSLNKPNSSQSTQGSLSGKISDTLTKWLRGEVDDMLPASVVSYNETTNRAVIRPLVMIGTTSGGKVPRAQVPNIPVFRFGGGGFFMRHPIKPGDFGWIKANDRDISLIMQAAGGMEWPNTERLHSFSDAMFFPDTVKDWVISGGNVDASVWQSLDGATCIALHDDKIELTQGASKITISDAGVDIVSPALTHNGKNIGATHYHVGSPSTAVPV